MKIVTLSDLHGHLPEDLPEGDVLVITGDICPVEDHNIGHQKWWLRERFNLWLDGLPYDHEHIVCIAGNHDWIFMNAPNAIPNLACHYLKDSGVIVDGVKFYGHPHTPVFCDWAFNRDPEYLEMVDDNIPDATDVLLTHGPPYGVLDTVKERYWESYDPKAYLGCKILKKRVNAMPDLKLHVYGHIHSGHGIVKPSDLSENKTTFVNASYVNERYVPDYDIITVKI